MFYPLFSLNLKSFIPTGGKCPILIYYSFVYYGNFLFSWNAPVQRVSGKFKRVFSLFTSVIIILIIYSFQSSNSMEKNSINTNKPFNWKKYIFGVDLKSPLKDRCYPKNFKWKGWLSGTSSRRAFNSLQHPRLFY